MEKHHVIDKITVSATVSAPSGRGYLPIFRNEKSSHEAFQVFADRSYPHF